jgi:hypothetical protein
MDRVSSCPGDLAVYFTFTISFLYLVMAAAVIGIIIFSINRWTGKG